MAGIHTKRVICDRNAMKLCEVIRFETLFKNLLATTSPVVLATVVIWAAAENIILISVSAITTGCIQRVFAWRFCKSEMHRTSRIIINKT